ncbi:hypothetical protein T02_15844, partial [Trichinella nativa]
LRQIEALKHDNPEAALRRRWTLVGRCLSNFARRARQRRLLAESGELLTKMEFVKNRCLRCWYCWREKVGCLQSLEERHFEIFRLFVTFGSLICCCQLWHKFFIFPFVEENLPLCRRDEPKKYRSGVR